MLRCYWPRIQRVRLFCKYCILHAVAGLILVQPVNAKELVATMLDKKFKESYDPTAPVSGILLAGLSMGEDKGALDIHDIKIAAPLQPYRSTCIVARTRDGRYYSENRFNVPVATGDAKFARVDPATKKHAKDLAGYKGQNYGVVGRSMSKNTCEAVAELYLPRVADPESSKLLVRINSGSGFNYVSASLETTSCKQEDKKKLSSFSCRTLSDGTNIAFDTECELDVKPFMGKVYGVEVEIDNGIRNKTYCYPVLIPALSRS